MDSPGAAERRAGGAAAQAGAGAICELGRYTVPSEARVLLGRRVDGVVHVLDWPLEGRGRRYHVEAGFESKAELAVLVAEYRRRAELLGVCPMSREAVELTLSPTEPHRLDRQPIPGQAA